MGRNSASGASNGQLFGNRWTIAELAGHTGDDFPGRAASSCSAMAGELDGLCHTWPLQGRRAYKAGRVLEVVTNEVLAKTDAVAADRRPDVGHEHPAPHEDPNGTSRRLRPRPLRPMAVERQAGLQCLRA